MDHTFRDSPTVSFSLFFLFMTKKKRTSGESKGVIGYIRNDCRADKKKKDIGPKHS